MRFSSYGIHTRLHYLIERTGGLDKKVRKAWLKEKYGFDEDTVNIILMYDIENLLKENTIDEIKRLIEKKKSDEAMERERAANNLMTMLKNLCCDSNMLHLGNFFSRL